MAQHKRGIPEQQEVYGSALPIGGACHVTESVLPVSRPTCAYSAAISSSLTAYTAAVKVTGQLSQAVACVPAEWQGHNAGV